MKQHGVEKPTLRDSPQKNAEMNSNAMFTKLLFIQELKSSLNIQYDSIRPTSTL